MNYIKAVKSRMHGCVRSRMRNSLSGGSTVHYNVPAHLVHPEDPQHFAQSRHVPLRAPIGEEVEGHFPPRSDDPLQPIQKRLGQRAALKIIPPEEVDRHIVKAMPAAGYKVESVGDHHFQIGKTKLELLAGKVDHPGIRIDSDQDRKS